MKTVPFFVFSFALMMISACSGLGFPKSGKSNFVSQSQIQMIDPQPLRNGGKVQVSIFRAGPGIEVDEEFQKVAVFLSSGMIQVLSRQADRFDFLFSDTADQADLMIDGRIVGLGRRSFLQKILLRPETVDLAVEGQVISRTSGETLVVFRNTSSSRRGNQNHKDLAFIVGQKLADGILDKLQ